MTNKNTPRESQIHAEFQQRLKENLARVQVIKGEVLRSDKKPESTNKEC